MWFHLTTTAVAIAIILVLLPWARKKRLSNVTTVTMVAAVALLNLEGSHFALYIKIIGTLLAVTMWLLSYRFREQGPVVGAVLAGLAAIMILSG